ncbi:uncharacterized protein N7446_000280 [Penicillium canescens]|uniref:Hydrophobin n=1 Tax=Penicillium canescens TaxID=5083 RepID=A0AAD6N581_PENCN|nr:uncharacterized protein N7446_000280 [Penicillium canescens]KAJ6030657.1 hypothetical protein N7460_010923 [Penicillium canescens]KAJ6059627.1 hypothetical protein N7444_003266 [Penicillium canescens]KAJ6077344.1 hypothetical protein N7446_000280 [Penicillium canescens]
MLMKNILAAFTLAGLAIATPVEEDLEKRAACPVGGPTHNWCCATATNLNIFFIRGVGSNCQSNLQGVTCSGTRSRPLCCGGNQIVDTKSNGNKDVVCTV